MALAFRVGSLGRTGAPTRAYSCGSSGEAVKKSLIFLTIWWRRGLRCIGSAPVGESISFCLTLPGDALIIANNREAATLPPPACAPFLRARILNGEIDHGPSRGS